MTDNKKKKLVLFDGSSLAFRAFFAIPNLDSFVNKNGMHTNALYGFHAMMTRVLEKEKPTHALVAWDAGNTTFRNEYYDAYKGGRWSTPSEFREQMPFFKPLLDGLGVAHYDLVNYEADDIIGTLAMGVDPSEFDVVVISGDKDLIQLAREHIRVDITKKGVSELQPYSPASIQGDLGITPEQIVDMKGLMGDSSDNYPGVTNIGEKTALKLLHEYGSVEGVYAHIDEMKVSKRKENLINDKDNAYLSKKLARIETHSPVEKSIDELKYQGYQTERLMAFYKDMNFNTFMSALIENTDAIEAESENWQEINYTVISSADAITEEMFNYAKTAIYLEMFEVNYHDGKIIQIAWGSDENIYVGPPELVLNSDLFKNWAGDASRKKIVFDAKRTKVILGYEGIDFSGVIEDVLIGSYLLNAKDNSHDLAEVARDFAVAEIQYDEQIYGKGAKRSIPDLTIMQAHLARKINAIWQLAAIEKEKLKQDNMQELYEDIELPLSLVLANMEIQGISVNRNRLMEMQKEFAVHLKKLEQDIHSIAGHEFNVNSTKQLGVVLFEELGLPPVKKTKTGYSTAQPVLEKLQGKSPIIDLILAYRQLAKLQSTYIEGLQAFIHEDGKIHTRFVQTLTTTGRLSSADPNLQNIPIRTLEGRKIRQAFEPSQPGWKIFASDYSQIELRVLAHISGDVNMQAAFKNNKDIHASTASRVFGVPEEEVTSRMRRDAKAVNFGIVYGISDYGLSQNLNISRPAAKKFIDTYFEKYPQIAEYMANIVLEAREKGYVETLFKRRRYLPDINAKNFNIRSFAERNAMNTPIQGSAADIIKIAMLRMDRELHNRGLKAKMLLQVHDELIFEAPLEEIEILEKIVPEVMESAVKLDVPLQVESSHGDTWFDAK